MSRGCASGVTFTLSRRYIERMLIAFAGGSALFESRLPPVACVIASQPHPLPH
jgi:hypothetical protein